MSKLSDRVLSMTDREIEDVEWRSIAAALRSAKEKFKEHGLGNQSWLDGDIGIAEQRAKLKHCVACGCAVDPSSAADESGEHWCATCDQAGCAPSC